MSISLDKSQLEALMKSFHILSGIRFVLFDTDFQEIMAYPEDNCNFCKAMKSYPNTKRKCNYADRRSFLQCEKQNSLIVYKCHAGLVEAVMPLHENEKTIGYLMFGQITDCPDKEHLYKYAAKLNEKYNLDMQNLNSGINEIPYKEEQQILAAAKIMEACTSYIIYKELIKPEHNKIIESAKLYIEEHLNEEINIEFLCSELNVGRTKLYEIFRKDLNMGISKYILYRRMHKAKRMLKTTELPITEIASLVGFSDYNYFSRVYKKFYGKSPRHYRK